MLLLMQLLLPEAAQLWRYEQRGKEKGEGGRGREGGGEMAAAAAWSIGGHLNQLSVRVRSWK